MNNVVGVHIHSGSPGENSHIHLVDIIPTDLDTRTNLSSSSPLTGEISVSDLCPGAHNDEHDGGGDGDDGHDDGHSEEDDSEFLNDGGNGTSDGPDADDVSKIHIHNAILGQNGPHALNIFGDPAEDDADMTFDAQTSTIMGVWDDEDENTELSDSAQSKKLSEMLFALCSEKLYLNIHTTGFTSGAIRGQILVYENSNICDPPSLISGRVISDNKIILEFDKPIISDLSHFTNLEIPVGKSIPIESLSVHTSSYGHGIVIIQTGESLHDILDHGEITVSSSLSDILGNFFDAHDNPLHVANILGDNVLTLSHDSPNLILSDDSTLHEIVIESGVETTLDLTYSSTTTTTGDHTTIIIPSNMTITTTQNNKDVRIDLPGWTRNYWQQ